MKPIVRFNYGDNVYLLISRVKKELSKEDVEKYTNEIIAAEDYDEVIKLSKDYVRIVGEDNE